MSTAQEQRYYGCLDCLTVAPTTTTWTDAGMLDAIGISADEEALYRALLRMPRAGVAALAQETGLPAELIPALLAGLRERGFAAQTQEGDMVALHPRLAVEPLISDGIRSLEHTRRALSSLIAEFEEHAGSLLEVQPLVDVLADRTEVALRFGQMQRAAEVQIRAFDTPPYVIPPGINADELEALTRGVDFRIVYAREALEMPLAMDALATHTRGGEQARVIESLPLKMSIVDDRAALIAYRTPVHGQHTSLLVHPSPLLTALIELFEVHWRLAMPVRMDENDAELNSMGITASDLRLVTMMAAGMKDPAIARQLQMSPRTVQRRVHFMSHLFGARNRLELLLHFARRGLVPDAAASTARRPAPDAGP
jgi:sugar-specific transcriptional regulator TrmB/DNA-binding CsgD family transcriptional regulator